MDVAVVGAGIGGLSAAVCLAGAGLSVAVVERGACPGGKAGFVEVDGLRLDTGPSVLTLPHLLDGVFREAGTTLAREVTLVRPSPAFRYRWPDKVVLDVYPEVADTLDSVRQALGAQAARELSAYLDYARQIWETAAPRFVLGPAPTPGRLLRLGPKALLELTRIDPWRTMAAAIEAQIRSPHLRDLLLRYATYNGSDPRRAPATLNCIGHVELGLGPFGVQGGMHALVEALARVAKANGVEIACGTEVQGIAVEGGRVTGLRLAGGGTLQAKAVVCNADVAHLARDLLPHRCGLTPPRRPSTSGWTAWLRARPAARVAHEVLFPSDYRQEFVDLFDHDRPPTEPTVYLCAPHLAHCQPTWTDAEPIFVMANAPALQDGAKGDWRALRAAVMGRLEGIVDGTIVWERTPGDLAARFPGTGGALYGAASDSMTAAFARPANRVPGVRGLYLASGSAHPGGGVPLCARSGQAAAHALLEDR